MSTSFILNFDTNTDFRGELISLENQKNVPFDIKRIFYIFNVPNNEIERGKHSNVNTKLVLISLNGSCSIDCEIGNTKKTYHLNSPRFGLYIQNGVSKRIYNFEKNTILLCLCSELYDENEYKE